MKTEVVIIQCFSFYSASDPMTTYNTQVVVPQASCGAQKELSYRPVLCWVHFAQLVVSCIIF